MVKPTRPSVSPDEKKFREELFPDIKQVKNKNFLCTSCGRSVRDLMVKGKPIKHPFLATLFCEKCSKFFGDGIFSEDEDGCDKYCRWCGQGGTLFLCSKCTAGFCKRCVKRNLPRSALQELENDDWECYCCETKPLFELRAQCWAAEQYSDLVKGHKSSSSSSSKSSTKRKAEESSSEEEEEGDGGRKSRKNLAKKKKRRDSSGSSSSGEEEKKKKNQRHEKRDDSKDKRESRSSRGGDSKTDKTKDDSKNDKSSRRDKGSSNGDGEKESKSKKNKEESKEETEEKPRRQSTREKRVSKIEDEVSNGVKRSKWNEIIKMSDEYACDVAKVSKGLHKKILEFKVKKINFKYINTLESLDEARKQLKEMIDVFSSAVHEATSTYDSLSDNWVKIVEEEKTKSEVHEKPQMDVDPSPDAQNEKALEETPKICESEETQNETEKPNETLEAADCKPTKTDADAGKSERVEGSAEKESELGERDTSVGGTSDGDRPKSVVPEGNDQSHTAVESNSTLEEADKSTEGETEEKTDRAETMDVDPPTIVNRPDGEIKENGKIGVNGDNELPHAKSNDVPKEIKVDSGKMECTEEPSSPIQES